MTGRKFAGRFYYFELAFMSLVVLAALGTATVRADVAYLCEGGRIVKVPVGKLEEMKRTDACIAAHYGLKVAPVRQIETGAIEAAERPKIVASPAPILVPSKPVPPAMAPPAGPASRAVPTQTASIEKSTSLRAAAGTDFRNVVLLNPEPGQPAIFHHER